VNLTAKLIKLGIPAQYRNLVIKAVTTGSTAAQAASFEKHAGAAIKAIINKVVNAAYDALAHGLNIALVASALLMLSSAGVAYFTGTSEKLEMVELDVVALA
jgi:hypothetical protein